MFVIFFLLVYIVLVLSRNLLLVLLVLEVIGFMVLYFAALFYSTVSCLDFFLLVYFTVLVIGGVIGLSGLVSIVSFSGNDYISVSTPLNL